MIRLFHHYVSAKGIVLFVLETALIVFALIWGARIRFWNDLTEFDVFINSPWFISQMLAPVLVFQICFLYGGLYAPRTLNNRNEQITSIGNSLGSGCLVLAAGYFLFPTLQVGRGVSAIGAILLAVSILVVRTVLNAAWRVAENSQNTLILGNEALAAEVACQLSAREDLAAHIVGFLGASPVSVGTKTAPGYPVIGLIKQVEAVVQKRNVTRIIVAVEDRRGVLPIRQLLRLRFEGLNIEDAHDTLAALNGRVSLKTIQPSWFIFSDGFRRSGIVMAGKRCSDLIFGIIGMVVTLPLMAAVAIAVWLDDRSPIIYRQTRVGLRGRHFDLLKFRSMRTDAEKMGEAQWAATDDPRVTRVGKYLRKFRLDELPQFLNIIRGEMSFIGPRPERPQFVQRLCEVIPYYDERHLVRPGLTGWAQVQYTYGSSEEEAFRKLEYDLFYLKNMSMSFDLLILAKTLRIVFTGHGAR